MSTQPWSPPTAAQEACPVCGHAIDAEHKTPSMAHGPCAFTDDGARCVFGPMHAIGYHHLDDGRNVPTPPADAPEQQDDEREWFRALVLQQVKQWYVSQGIDPETAADEAASALAALASRRPAEADQQWREQVAAAVIGTWVRTGSLPNAADELLSLLSAPAGAADQLVDLVAELQRRRREMLQALRASTDVGADYWRWQGHAELARQLLERLGAEVPQ